MIREFRLRVSVVLLLTALGGCAQQTALREVPQPAPVPVVATAPVALPRPTLRLPDPVLRCARYSEEGVASWYGRRYQGRRTASGERFDMNRFTAAHRDLPFGTRIDVTNLENGRTISVVINDRGPHGLDRILDLSRRAAGDLGFLRAGLARVLITGEDCG